MKKLLIVLLLGIICSNYAEQKDKVITYGCEWITLGDRQVMFCSEPPIDLLEVE
jgi:hypothetical protein